MRKLQFNKVEYYAEGTTDSQLQQVKKGAGKVPLHGSMTNPTWGNGYECWSLQYLLHGNVIQFPKQPGANQVQQIAEGSQSQQAVIYDHDSCETYKGMV
jgi:hypothetical protein